VLLEELEAFSTELVQEEEEEAKAKAEMDRSGLTMFTDGPGLGGGMAGYAVVWKNGQTWKGIKTHMEYNQKAYDAECAVFTHALGSASQRNTGREWVAILDTQAAIRWMASEEPDPGQQYVIQARKHIVVMRHAQPGIAIEIRWCPTHKGIAGNEKADKWINVTAVEPDTHGVEWLNYKYDDGRKCGRCLSHNPLPTSSGRSWRRSGWRRTSRYGAGPPKRNTGCQRTSGRMAQ